MTDPSNPTYTLAESNPAPEFAPEHEFVEPNRGALLPCWHTEFVLDSGHIVRCGLPRRLHPPAPHSPPWDRAIHT